MCKWFKLCLTYHERNIWRGNGATHRNTEKAEELVLIEADQGPFWRTWQCRVSVCVFKICGWEERDLMAVNGSLLSSRFKLQKENMALAQLGSHAQWEGGSFDWQLFKILSNEGKGFPKVRGYFQKEGNAFWVGGRADAYSTVQTVGRWWDHWTKRKRGRSFWL